VNYTIYANENVCSWYTVAMHFLALFSHLTAYLESIITQTGYIFLFFVTTLEGVPLFGMFVPGHISIIIAGFFAKLDTLDLWWVLVVVLIGAVIGDYIGYYLGGKYGMKFIDRFRPYFFISDSHIDRANALLSKHTGKALIIGRFSPVTRALMPFLVGVTRQTSARQFWIFNTIGAILWVGSSIMIGYIFGAGYHVAAGYFGKFALFAVITSAIILWGYYFANKRFHVFKRYELFVVILNILSLYGLARTIQDAWAPRSFMANFDIYVNTLSDKLALGYPFVTSLFGWITTLGSTKIIGGLSLILLCYFLYRKRWRSAAIVVLSVGSTGFMLGIMKSFFMRVRPDNALWHISGDPSFPSGHAGMAAVFFVVIAYLYAPKIKSLIRRELYIVACVAAIVLIGLSRIVLNVHWASDVIAGWSLGIFLATTSILLVRYVSGLLQKKGVQ
jgi:membrane protein DedA with SNARE-associated domain/membrane-associated phospholipid phosphatase